MPRSMAPLKKPRNTTKLPLALNPLKSKDVVAVLAERNPPSVQGCQLHPGEILAGMRNAHLGFIPPSPEHPGASHLARPMTTEHLTKKLHKKKN